MVAFDEFPKKASTMDGFYEKSKTERGISDSQVSKVRGIFSKQGLNFLQLMEHGDLALTDGKLENCGVAQLGIRTAAIRDNQ